MQLEHHISDVLLTLEHFYHFDFLTSQKTNVLIFVAFCKKKKIRQKSTRGSKIKDKWYKNETSSGFHPKLIYSTTKGKKPQQVFTPRNV